MYRTAYETRCDALIDFFADREAGDYLPYTEFVEVAARLYRDYPLEQIRPDLDQLLADPHGDMFWMIPMVLMVYLGRSRLSETDTRRMRGDRPFVFTNLKTGDGVDVVADFVARAGGMVPEPARIFQPTR